MKKISIFSLLVSLLVLSNSYAQSSKKGKWIHLFNKKDLSGWKIYGTEKWYVDKGELICESGPDKEYGYLGTEQKLRVGNRKLPLLDIGRVEFTNPTDVDGS